MNPWSRTTGRSASGGAGQGAEARTGAGAGSVAGVRRRAPGVALLGDAEGVGGEMAGEDDQFQHGGGEQRGGGAGR
ncbi:hypothetical protein YUWDRAFT_02303 [Streptomyces sp. AmelKG-D3]|nr:hypothetical protein YUWDRAFT_02303 [Streptomyces sp. AmelKG-D3]